MKRSFTIGLFSILLFAAGPAKATPEFHVCSTLSFKNLDWEKHYLRTEKEALILALNISGSYEGGDSWQNLTNDFDSQGVSLGLLNQCLGQGSLQALWIQMRDKHADEMRQVLTSAQVQDVEAMLSAWEAAPPPASEVLARAGFSRLDDVPVPQPDRDKSSVDWAMSTLYSDADGLTFKPEWKKALTELAGTTGYRSLQLGEALTYHNRAVALFEHFKAMQVRSYLFFFDLVVQDGGINDDVLKEIDMELAKTPAANEKQRLKTILQIRLKYVKPQYVEDVRLRKQALIDGKGIVHGVLRNFDSEYCTELSARVRFGEVAP